MADLLVDTEVFIDHLRGTRELKTKRHRLSCSVVTRAELFDGNTATDLSVQPLAPFRELDVTRAVAHSSTASGSSPATESTSNPSAACASENSADTLAALPASPTPNSSDAPFDHLIVAACRYHEIAPPE